MKATIILPTTADRGPVLKYAVESVLQQTEQDWELFIIGDGVNDSTRDFSKSLAESDPRISYFDFPKDGSRGELNRHQLLTNEAKGEVVCYLCDRDLYLENHIELMCRALQSCDIVNSMLTLQRDDGRIKLLRSPEISLTPEVRARKARDMKMVLIPLSMVAHRLDAYKKLPHGWRITPSGLFTDSYMWQQFYACDWVRVSIIWSPTVVYLKRGNFPGLSSRERAEESRRFSALYIKSGGVSRYQVEVNKSIVAQKISCDERIERYKRRAKPFWKRILK